jgi:hypothetical protein
MTATSTGVDKTSGTCRFKLADNTNADTNSQLYVPAAGTVYSYTKHYRLYLSDADGNSINNLVAYTDGANGYGTGITLEYDTSGSFSSNVATDISGTDLFTKTSGSPIDMDATNSGPWTDTDNASYMGDFLRMQMHVASTASGGTLTAETLTYVYDETIP